MPIGELFPEFLAVALVSETCVATLGSVQAPIVATVCAVLLASDLADDRLVGRACFVCHVVLEFVTSSFRPYDFDFFLGNPDRLVALGTDVHAQLG